MNTKAVKQALLKMNSEEIKSPREINALNTPQIPKKTSNSFKNQFILSNMTKINPQSAYKLHLSNNHLEIKKVLSHRSESRNNKLANVTNNGTTSCTSNPNYKSNLNSHLGMIISPSSKLHQDINSGDLILMKRKNPIGILPPQNLKKNGLGSYESHNSSKGERLKTPKTSSVNHNRIGSNSKAAESVEIMSLLSNQNYVPLSISTLDMYFANYESTKSSTKQINQLKGYAANTNQGIIRNYNEDRVSIILNIAKPDTCNSDYWPMCSFFAVYDGHGGSLCADFLRDNLHNYIIKDKLFPDNPAEAIKNGFSKAENDFIYNYALSKEINLLDRSGSCAVITLIVDDTLYIANVGDSRAVLSKNNGENVSSITVDHKPSDLNEQKRINLAGGKVYQTQVPSNSLGNMNLDSLTNKNQILVGPYRIFPGRLSVSRSFGDIEAKLSQFGGMNGVLIAIPDVFTIKINDNIDFLVMGCDGIFDQLSNKEVVESVWISTKEKRSFNQHCCMAVDMIMKSSLARKTLDNVTVVFLAFENFEKAVIKQSPDIEKKVNSELPDLVNSGIHRSNTKKLILEEKNLERENLSENNSEKKKKMTHKYSADDKILENSKNGKFTSSKNIPTVHQSISKILNSNPKKLPFVENKKFFYVNPKNQKIDKLKNFETNKNDFNVVEPINNEFNLESNKLSKHVTIDSIPTNKARNGKILGDFFNIHNQSQSTTNKEINKKRSTQYQFSKLKNEIDK